MRLGQYLLVTRIILLIGLIWALPLVLGGVTNVGMAILFAVAPLIVLLSLLERDTGGASPSPDDVATSSDTDFSTGFFVIWIVVSVCILIDPLFDWLALRTPSALASQTNYSLVHSSVAHSISYFGFFSAFWGIAWVVHRLNTRSVAIVLAAIVAMGLFQAMYGLVSFASQADTILGWWPRSEAETATGSFYNSNHFAGYIEITLPVLLGSAFALQQKLDQKYRSLLIIATVVCLIILVIAIIASRSRLGLVGLLAGLVVYSLLIRNKDYQGSRQKLLVLTGIFLTLAAALWFGMSSVVDEWLVLFQRGNARLDIWQSTFNFPFTWWLTGIGPGRFSDFYPLVQPAAMDIRYVYLHNDALQFVLELGLVRAAIIVATGGYLIVRQFKLGHSPLKVAALAAIVAIVVHSLGDFNLQVAGVAVAFWVAVGVLLNTNLALAEPQVRHTRRRRRRRSSSAANQPQPA